MWGLFTGSSTCVMKQKNNITPVILVGGKSKRFGEDKALLEIQGEPLIKKIYSNLFDCFHKEPILIGKKNFSFGFESFSDIIEGKGPIGGLYTALRFVDTAFVFLIGCDMPLINKELICYMIEKLEEDSMVYLPKFNNLMIEPLFAFYNHFLLNKVEDLILAGEYRMRSVLTGEKVQFLTEKEIERFDSDLSSFVNINTKSDLDKITALKNERD